MLFITFITLRCLSVFPVTNHISHPLAHSTSSCEKTLGHVDIRVTQNVPESLKPCRFARPSAQMYGAEAQKLPLSWMEKCAVLGERRVPMFAAGKLIFGYVPTTSATVTT